MSVSATGVQPSTACPAPGTVGEQRTRAPGSGLGGPDLPVGLHADGFFELEQERYVMDNGSKMEGNVLDVIEVYHRSFYLVTAGVREAVGDYVDYLTTYHVDGVEIGRLLKHSGEVVEAIRSDLGLETAFPDRRVDEDLSLDALEADEPDGEVRTTET